VGKPALAICFLNVGNLNKRAPDDKATPFFGILMENFIN